MKFKNKSSLWVAALSVVAAFSFGLVANVAFSKTETTQVSASADQGTWTYSDNKLSFSYKSGTSRAFVNRTEQTAVNGLGDGKYAITYEVWGYSSGAMQPEEDLLETIELEFIWGNYVESDTYGTITAYPADIPGLSSTTAYSIDVLVEPTGDMALTYPTWRYNIVNQNFVYYVDSQNTYDAELTTISFINFGQDNRHNYIRLDYDVTDNGSLVRRDSIGLYQASVVRYGESTGDGAVSGTYKNQTVAELGTGQISIDEVTIANGFNYIEINNEVIKYNENDDSIQTVFVTEATYNTDSSTANIFYVLRDESGQETENTEEAVLRNASKSYDDELQRYYITGTTGDFDGIDETASITLCTSNLNEVYNYHYVVHFDGNGATSGRMSDDPFTSQDYSVDYELPECSFERENYTFFAWSLSEDGMITIKPHETRNITYSEEGVIFYAIWGRTITFDSNGGNGYMEPIVVKEGYNEVPSCDFTRDGYAFKCWAVGSPTGIEINAGSRVNVDANYVLYAVWEQSGPVQHEGMWYDEELHKLRFYNTDLAKEQEVQLEAKVLDFGPNTAETRAELVACVLDKGELLGDYSYDMRSFTVGVDNSKRYISGPLDLDNGEGCQQVKLYPETFYYNTFKPNQLNYAEGYNQIFYVNENYEGTPLEFEIVEFNEITRVFRIEAYAGDVTGEQDLIEFTFELTDGVVLEGDLTQDAQLIEGYLEDVGRKVKLNVYDIQYNSLEEEAITSETIENITNAMDAVELSPDQISQINQKIEDNKEQIPDSTGGKIADALTNTAPTLSDDPEVLEAQKDVIVAVVETVIEVETNRPSDIGQSIRTDSSLPKNAGISIEQEVREFYELQMANLIGEEKANRRAILRAPTATDYKIDVSGKTKEDLEQDLIDYGTMTEFIDDSVQNMNTAGRKLRSCSGEAMKVEVKRTVVKIKTSSFRKFDKEAADLQFAYDVHNAMMLHLQEVVVTELEKDYKPSGNKEKDEQYQKELAACKDIESFTEIVIEVLRQKYNAITDSNVKYEDFVEISDDGKYSGIYWDIFEAWCLDKPCPYPITFQELTDATVDTTTQNARSFELNTKMTNTEVVFTAAFVGGGVAFISLAGVLGYILKKRSLKGVSK